MIPHTDKGNFSIRRNKLHRFSSGMLIPRDIDDMTDAKRFYFRHCFDNVFFIAVDGMVYPDLFCHLDSSGIDFHADHPSTVGFGEVQTVSSVGRIFTMVLIILGVGFVFYVVGSVVQFMMEGHVREILGRRKLQKEIRAQKGHYIICGYGRVGMSICDLLASEPPGIVVIERAPERIARLDNRNLLYVVGEATDEENLIS